MGNANWYKHGDPNMICDMCGHKYKKSDLQETWDHKWVCSYDFEHRQPQDRIRSFPDKQSVEDARPESNTTITYWTGSALASEQHSPSTDDFLDTNEVEAGDL